jgi:hypothetical protein
MTCPGSQDVGHTCLMCAGVLRESAAVRLQHMCDAIIVLEAFRDDSGISRMVADRSRCGIMSLL